MNQSLPMPTGEVIRGSAEMLAVAEGAEKKLAKRISELPRAAQELKPNPQRATRTTKSGGIAVIPVIGFLTKWPAWWSPWMAGTAMKEFQRDLAEAVADPEVAQILLFVDSAGGEVAGLDDAATAILEARERKPITAFCEDLAASGAFYLAACARRVVCNSAGWIGAIGVYSVVEDWSKAFEREGIRTIVTRSAPLKGAGTVGEAVTDEMQREWQRRVDIAHILFLRAVSKGRGLSLDAVDRVADGRLFNATVAREKGLVDAISTLPEVFAELAAEIAGRVRPKTPMLSTAERAALEEKRKEAAELADIRRKRSENRSARALGTR